MTARGARPYIAPRGSVQLAISGSVQLAISGSAKQTTRARAQKALTLDPPPALKFAMKVMPQPAPSGAAQTRADAAKTKREAAEAAALRANLLRRKAQARSKTDAETTAQNAPDAPEKDTSCR